MLLNDFRRRLFLGSLLRACRSPHLQRPGLEPAIRLLAMITLGFGVAVAGVPIGISVALFERQTGQTVLSTSHLSRSFGLETRVLRH